jgi:hypothetical protein
MTTVVENERSSGHEPDGPEWETDEGFGSAATRFDKVEADMREGFGRIDQDIRDLRGEMKDLGDSLRGEMNTRFLALEGSFKSLQNTLIGCVLGIVGALLVAILANKI